MESTLLKEGLGWSATAAFAASYFCRRDFSLRTMQVVAAGLWIGYGCVTGSLPVVASTAAVAFMAVVYPLVRTTADQATRSVPAASLPPESKAPSYEELPEIFEDSRWASSAVGCRRA